jgi:spermidine/putrescine transport system ATP-binding protein
MGAPPVAEAVSLSGVSKHFGDLVAVDDLDLAVGDGEFFSLLGPSGCGKTTTLRMIAGFEFPTKGSLKIHGHEMGLLPPNRRPVNTVFQSYALFPHMTIEENVGFGLKMKKAGSSEIVDRVGRALDMVQLRHRASASPDQLSGGQRQRVALARALVNEPEVLLLDEPLGALDLKLRQSMQLELKELQHRVGITFVYVTHDQEEALTMSDRIGVMNEGKLLQVDDPAGLYEHPGSRFVANFIGEINLLDGTVADATTVDVGGASIQAVSGASAGTPVALGIRPERLSLAGSEDDVADGRGRLPGTVSARIYHGDLHFYSVDTVAGMLRVKEENRPGLPLHDEGARVVVHWNPASVSVLAD